MRLRIDELANQTGTTFRNIRAYQARELLHPPALDGRTGYCDEDHVRRLEIISELQGRGFSLEAIRAVIDTWSQGGDLAHLIGFRHLIDAPFNVEDPTEITVEELLDIFPEAREDWSLIEESSISAQRVNEIMGPLERLRPVAMEIARPFLARSIRRSIDATVDHYRDVIERAEQPTGAPSTARAPTGRRSRDVSRTSAVRIEVGRGDAPGMLRDQSTRVRPPRPALRISTVR